MFKLWFMVIKIDNRQINLFFIHSDPQVTSVTTLRVGPNDESHKAMPGGILSLRVIWMDRKSKISSFPVKADPQMTPVSPGWWVQIIKIFENCPEIFYFAYQVCQTCLNYDLRVIKIDRGRRNVVFHTFWLPSEPRNPLRQVKIMKIIKQYAEVFYLVF